MPMHCSTGKKNQVYLNPKELEEGRRRTAMEVAYVTAAQTDKLNVTPARRLLSENRQTSKWEKPAPGEIKLNSDGALISSALMAMEAGGS